MPSRPNLSSLPLSEWEDTKTTLHLLCQIVGKVRLALMPPQNHWWHVPLYVSTRGLTTRPIPHDRGAFEVEFDLLADRLRVATTDGEVREFGLRDRSVSDFHARLFEILGELDIAASIVGRPYDLQFDTAFADDHAHASYDPEYVRRFWRILVWVYGVLSRFMSRFVGKTTPVHVFWHSFDIALTRFSGRRAPTLEGASAVGREAYTHEVISFGFWAGDQNVPEPTFYSYTYPEPEGLRDQVLEPQGAFWVEKDGGSLALYRYEDAQIAADPDEALLAFLESAYQAGGRLANWDLAGLRHPRWGV